MDQRFPAFFETNDYLIDQKVNMLKFENEYKVFNGNGDRIGSIKERMSIKRKILAVFIGKGALPFHFEIVDNDNNVLAKISKGWTFFLPKITVTDGEGQVIGLLKQKIAMLKPTFHMHDASMNKIGEIKGDWRAWNFHIKNENDQEVGTISKKWSGVMKEFFTTADKYRVTINENYEENANKIVIVSIAISIDMVLKESK